MSSNPTSATLPGCWASAASVPASTVIAPATNARRLVIGSPHPPAPALAGTIVARLVSVVPTPPGPWPTRLPMVPLRASEEAREKRARTGRVGIRENLLRRPLLDDRPVVHDDHAIGQVRGEGHLVRHH